MFLGILSAVTSIFSSVAKGSTGVLGAVAEKVPISFYAGLCVGLVITDNAVRSDGIRLAKDVIATVV